MYRSISDTYYTLLELLYMSLILLQSLFEQIKQVQRIERETSLPLSSIPLRQAISLLRPNTTLPMSNSDADTGKENVEDKEDKDNLIKKNDPRFQKFDLLMVYFYKRDAWLYNKYSTFRLQDLTRDEIYIWINDFRRDKVNYAKMIVADPLFLSEYSIKENEKILKDIDVLEQCITCLEDILKIPYKKPTVVYDKEDCPVCCENLDNQINPLSCGHWCHKVCMDKWKAKTSVNICPVCKKKHVTYTD